MLPAPTDGSGGAPKLLLRSDRPRQQFLDAVPVARPAGAESIARTAGVGMGEVATTLTRLAELDLVEGLPGGSATGAVTGPVTWRLTTAARTTRP